MCLDSGRVENRATNARARRTVVGESGPGTIGVLVATMLILGNFAETNGNQRPEVTLLEILGSPLVPTDAIAASAECLEHSALYLAALGNYTPWALQMYDASAKISPGILTGNIKQMGNYDQCLRVATSQGFSGQSCTASVRFKIPENASTSESIDMKDLLTSIAAASGLKNWTYGATVTYEWSWCVPSTCTHQEIQETLHLLLDQLIVEGRLELTVDVGEDACHTAKTDERILDKVDWIYIALLLLFLTVAIVSTVIDLLLRRKYQERRKDKREIILTSFSIYTNGKAILNAKRHGDSIGCLDGLRFLSICWIIYGHTHYLQATGVQLDVSHVSTMHENWSTLLVLNGNIVTDTFLLLSGLLLAYTEYSQKQRNPGKTLNVPRLYAHRYFRLTPAYAMVVGLYATIYYKFGSGPQWNANVAVQRDFCRDNWWTNLLYVNNEVNVAEMCMSQSWYLSVDMQLVWISPIFLYPMMKFTRGIIFWTVIGIGLFVSVVVPFVITYANSLAATMLYYKDPTGVGDVYLSIYTKTYARAGPYIAGLGLGYLLCQTRSSSLKIPKIYAILGWIVAVVCIGSVVFGPRGMYFEHYEYNRIESSIYAGVHRVVFALSISWIIFACTHGIAGPVNAFLAWKAWMPLSKLTYTAYLIHYLVLFYNSGTVRTPAYLTSYTVVHEFFGNLVIVMGLSMVAALLFEMPFIVLDRALLGKSRRPADSTASVPNGGSTAIGGESYRSIDESISSDSSMFAKVEDGAYVTPIDPSAGYYVDQFESRTAKCEHEYAYIVESERQDDARRSRTIEEQHQPTTRNHQRRLPCEGVDNRAYQH